MSEDHSLAKIEILIQQGKYKEAENILSNLLSQDPININYLSLLAEVNMHQGKPDQAIRLIDSAIGLSPDNPLLYYKKSHIILEQGNYSEAERYIRQAIQLDAYYADFHALLAFIQLGRKQYEEALEVANQALEIDPENLLALNTRSTALNKLNRKEESFETIQGAFREDPNNAFTHANYGWGLLEQGDHKKALEHFKEALTREPGSEYAQAGMREALKAANPVYRAFLRYSFWMGNLTAKYQWGVVLGFYVGFRALRAIANKNEALQPYLNPLLMLLALIAFSTWVIEPISNFFLRFNKYGQLLLNKKEKMSSNFVASSLALFVSGVLLYFILGDQRYLAIAGFGFFMTIPLGSMFAPTKKGNALVIYAIAMAVVGMGAVAIAFKTTHLFNGLTILFALGLFAFQWVVSAIAIKEDNR